MVLKENALIIPPVSDVFSPRRQGLKQVNGTGHNNGQGPAATT
ncbi:hypothetical protein ECP02989422_4841 [Escherichia coli P0298942.2]|nr:hypothetical protein ECP02989422_4841 [Escherichia coli P0298942.2]